MLECYVNRASWHHPIAQHGQMDIGADQRDFGNAIDIVRIEVA